MLNKIILFIAVIIFLIVGVLTLPHYGINWDTINHLPRGQAYLNFFLTGKKDFSNLPPWKQYWQDPDSLWIKSDIPKGELPIRSLYQNNGTTFSWFLTHDGDGHPPLSDELSSLFNLVFFQKLRLINDIDAYRLYGVFLAAMLVGLVYYWVSSLYGKFAGLISSLSLALYPLFWSESHFNTEKDIPEMVYWSFFIFCFWTGVTKKNIKWILLSGIFFGLALGTKFNILFCPAVIVPWLIIYLFRNKKRLISKVNFKIFFACFIAIIIGVVIFIGSWPYLWADPLTRIENVLKFYKTIGTTENIDPKFTGLFNISLYPTYAITYMTPIVILILFIVGIFLIFRYFKKDTNSTSILFLLWFFVSIARVSLPGANIYGGLRQIMEYIPSMAIIAGIGGSSLKNWLSGICGNKISYLIVIALFIPITLKLIEIHPNENVYFNMLIGGLKGAKAADFPYWGNSFGASYREGVSWIDKNAEKEAKIDLAFELLPNIPSIFFRRDIIFQNSVRSGFLQNGEYSITLNYQGTESRSYYDEYLANFIKPVYSSIVDGIPVVTVWKNDAAHVKKQLIEKTVPNPAYKKLKSGLIFDLRKEYSVARLVINYSELNCLKLDWGEVRLSKDNVTWASLPGILPKSWAISALGEQPNNGSFIEPFVGQEARYIDLELSPADTCLKNVKSFKIYYLVQNP